MDKMFKMNRSPDAGAGDAGDFFSENFLKNQEHLGEELRKFVAENSEKIIDEKYNLPIRKRKEEGEDVSEDIKELPGYEIKKIIPPGKEEVFYNGGRMTEQLKEVIKKHPEVKNLEVAMRLAEYLEGSGFVDTAIDDKQRHVMGVHLAGADPNIASYYENDKFRAQKMTNPLKLLEYPDMFFGDTFVVTSEMKKLAEELKKKLSIDVSMVRNSHYDKMSEKDRTDAMQIATKLCRAICVQLIETYK